MQIEDIKNVDSFCAWLDEQGSREVSVTTAARAALRVQPVLWSRLAPSNSKRKRTALEFVRSVFTSVLSARKPTVELRRVAASAADAARVPAKAIGNDAQAARVYSDEAPAHSFMAFNEEAHAANAAAAVADATTHAAAKDPSAVIVRASHVGGTNFYNEMEIDAGESLEGHRVVLEQPLWRDVPEHLAEAWARTRDSWEAAGAPWNAFARIYNDFWEGWEPDWANLEQIVLIDPEVWKAGPEAVAEAIAEIDAARATIDAIVDATSNAEQVVVDDETGKLTAVPVAALGPEFRDEIARDIERAVRRFFEVCDAPQLSNFGQVLKDTAESELRYLMEDLRDASLGDRQFYDAIEQCKSSLRDRFSDTGGADDRNANRLLNELETAGLTVLASSDEVREIVHRRNAELFYQLQLDHRVVLEEMVVGMARDSLPGLANALKADWETALDESATDEDRRRAQYNTVSRLPRGARAISYSRFDAGRRVVPDQLTDDRSLWWATMLSPSVAVLLSKMLGL